MHIPFPAASSNNTQCPFPSVCRSSRPRRATSRQLSGAAGALVLRAIQGRRDPGERKGERRRFPLLSQLSGRMYLCFCVVDGKLRLSQANCLACTGDLGHDAVCWGIVWTCFIFTLAFANKKKTLIFFYYFFLLLRLIHANLFFGLAIARDAPALGCRRTEEAVPAGVQGSYPSSAQFSPHLTAEKGAFCITAQRPCYRKHGTGYNRGCRPLDRAGHSVHEISPMSQGDNYQMGELVSPTQSH